MYFGFNIWYAVVTYVHCVTIEQFNKFIMWGAMLSYKIQKRISDFCFDINSKWRVKPNSILFSILFVVFNVFVCRVTIQGLSTAEFFLRFLVYFFWFVKYGFVGWSGENSFFNRCGEFFKDDRWKIWIFLSLYNKFCYQVCSMAYNSNYSNWVKRPSDWLFSCCIE